MTGPAGSRSSGGLGPGAARGGLQPAVGAARIDAPRKHSGGDGVGLRRNRRAAHTLLRRPGTVHRKSTRRAYTSPMPAAHSRSSGPFGAGSLGSLGAGSPVDAAPTVRLVRAGHAGFPGQDVQGLVLWVRRVEFPGTGRPPGHSACAARRFLQSRTPAWSFCLRSASVSPESDAKPAILCARRVDFSSIGRQPGHPVCVARRLPARGGEDVSDAAPRVARTAPSKPGSRSP
jgi:hypothetical protein